MQQADSFNVGSSGGTAESLAAKHTPGPWAWEGNALRPTDLKPGESAVHTILDDEHGGRGFIGSDFRDTIAENDANRRLIAAAPALLDALQHLVRWHDQLSPADIEKARIAIASATEAA